MAPQVVNGDVPLSAALAEAPWKKLGSKAKIQQTPIGTDALEGLRLPPPGRGAAGAGGRDLSALAPPPAAAPPPVPRDLSALSAGPERRTPGGRGKGQGKGRGKSSAFTCSAKAQGATGPQANGDAFDLTEGAGVPEGDSEAKARPSDTIFHEIRAVVDLHTNALKQIDFDFRVRQHLHAMLGNGGKDRLSDALDMIKYATAGKDRKTVKNWPAYLGALLKKFDQDRVSEDREAKAQAKAQASPEEEEDADEASFDKGGDKTEARDPGNLDDQAEPLLPSAVPGGPEDVPAASQMRRLPPPPQREAPAPPLDEDDEKASSTDSPSTDASYLTLDTAWSVSL